MKKVLLIIIIAGAIAGGAFLVTRKPASDNLSTEPTTQTQTQNTQTTETPSKTDSDETTVTYNGSSFSPASVTVKPGTKVNFVNQSSSPMWVASDPHPVHTDFSAFDASRGYTQGQTYSFTFDQAGQYGYHNHLNSGSTGVVVVE